MRTRARGLASPPPTSPLPLPDTVTIRKRRRESAPALLLANELSPPATSPTTPRRGKRVRFSEPGVNNLASGLTPHLRRSTLSSRPEPTTPRTGRRQARQPTALPSPPTSPIKLYFSPLKQILDPRVKRRLRRSHLSETINDIEAEQRQERREERQQREAQQAREERIKELELELELQRQLGIEVNTEEEQRISDLEKERDFLRNVILEQTRDTPGLPSSDWNVEFDEWVDEHSDDTWMHDPVLDDYEADYVLDSVEGEAPEAATQTEPLQMADERNDDAGMSDPILDGFQGEDRVDSGIDVGTLRTEAATQTEPLQMVPADQDHHTIHAEAGQHPFLQMAPNEIACGKDEIAHRNAMAVLKDTVTFLTADNTELQSILFDIHIELLTLGFSTSSDSSEIIAAIKSSFDTARAELERLSRDETVLELTAGKPVLTALLAHLKRVKGDHLSLIHI